MLISKLFESSPCPFCGCEDVVVVTEHKIGHRVKCIDCGALGPLNDHSVDGALWSWISRSIKK